MISKRLAAILLILGPIITVIAAFTGPLGPEIDWGDTQAVLGGLAQANTDMAKISFLILDVGLLMSVIGFRYFIVGMNSNDRVSNYSSIGGMLLIIGISVVLGEQFLYGAAAEAAAMPGGAGMGTAAAMWAGGQALRFLTERRKEINYQIDYELELKLQRSIRSYGYQRRADRISQAADGTSYAVDSGQSAYDCAVPGRIGCHSGTGTSSQ